MCKGKGRRKGGRGSDYHQVGDFDIQAEGLWSELYAVILKPKSSNLYYTINCVYVRILSIHFEVISSEQLHLKPSNASEYCVGT